MISDISRATWGMAAGTAVARVTGYARSVLLVAALGSGLHADLFAIANTLPTMLSVLLGAGIFNAVLVPQVVRADREGDGARFVNQVLSLGGGVLLLGAVLLTATAPLVIGLVLPHELDASAYAEQRDSVVSLGYLCLPQVFFYGAFALVGQILNARGVFGPMMWMPVLNNVVSVAVLATYLAAHGNPVSDCEGYSRDQELLLGLGATAGVMVQTLALLPCLRRAGVRFRPTWRVRSPRIRETLRLGGWTVLLVAVNQVAYACIVRLAAGGTVAEDGCSAGQAGTGYTVYSSAYLLIMAPHAVVTVSLMTALLPRLSAAAADGRFHDLGRRLVRALGAALLVIVPVVGLLEILAPTVAELVWGYGAGAEAADRFVPAIRCFGLALLFFTCHYVALRGLYALQALRTVVAVQVVIAVVNVGAAIGLLARLGPEATAPALAIAYAVAYAVGAALSWTVLRRRLLKPA